MKVIDNKCFMLFFRALPNSSFLNAHLHLYMCFFFGEINIFACSTSQVINEEAYTLNDSGFFGSIFWFQPVRRL